MDFVKIFAVFIGLLEAQAQEEGVEQKVTFKLIKKEDTQETDAV